MYAGKRPPQLERVEEVMDETLPFNYDTFEDPDIEDDFDEETVERDIHNLTVHEMQEELLHSINNRKKDVLEIAVGLFNKMQDKLVPTRKLKALDRLNEKSGLDETLAIGETLDLVDKLLSDQRSPLISALNTFG